jgi:hypothetical protein
VPLRIRLALIFAAATAVVLAVGGLVFVNQLSSGVRRTTDSTLTTRAANIANALAEPGSRPVEVLEKSRAAPLPLGGSESHIVDRNGKVLAASATSRTPMLRADVVRKARSGALHFTGGTDAPQRYIVVGITHRGEPMSIVVRSDLQAGDEAIDRVERLFLLGGVPLVLLAGVAGWLIARAALRPVERMRSEVAAMTHDEVGPVLDLPRTRDEIAALTTTMNDLL